jgi:hypothetical protein
VTPYQRAKQNMGFRHCQRDGPLSKYIERDDNLPTFGPFVDKGHVPRLKAAWQNGTVRGMVAGQDSVRLDGYERR